MLSWLSNFFKSDGTNVHQSREEMENLINSLGCSSKPGVGPKMTFTAGVRLKKYEQYTVLANRVVDMILPQDATSVSDLQREKLEKIKSKLSSFADQFYEAGSEEEKNALLDQFNGYWGDYILHHSQQNAAPAQRSVQP